MTDVRTKNLKLILGENQRVKRGQNLLVIADNYARSMALAREITDLAISMGIEAVLAMMKLRKHAGDEPPPTVAAAMKAADVVIQVSESYDYAHTNAREEAGAAGIRCGILCSDIAEDYLQIPFTLEDLKKVKERTEKVAAILTKGNTVRLTTPHGTDLTFSIKGRPGREIHGLAPIMCPCLDYAEAAVIPVEGTTEGLVVIDSSVQGWRSLLRKPIRFEVKKGMVQLETISSDIPEHAERFKKLMCLDEMACNCAAELGIGTGHDIEKGGLQGHLWDYAAIGTMHIACGRNRDIGGTIYSTIHQDNLMTEATIKVDDVYVMENGELKF